MDLVELLSNMYQSFFVALMKVSRALGFETKTILPS